MITKELQNKTYTLTDNKTYDQYEIADILSKVRGQKHEYKPVTSEEYSKILENEYGLKGSINKIIISLYESMSKGQDDIITNDFEIILQRKPTTLIETLNKHNIQ